MTLSMSAKKLITVGGETHTMAEWARKLGCSRQNVHARLKRHIPSDAIRDADGRAVVQKRVYSTWVLCRDGRHRDVKTAAAFYEVSPQTVRRWIRERRLQVYRERDRGPRPYRCSFCGQSGCSLNRCPKLYLEDRAGRRVPYAPPSEEELRDAGILPSTQAPGAPDE